MMRPLSAADALNTYYLEARSKILDLAGILDRIGRGESLNETSQDARLAKIQEALGVLADQSGGRAERIQQIFSLAYDPAWKRPSPK